MYARVEKSKEKQSRAVANSIGQRSSNVKQENGFVDNRPQSILQRKFLENSTKHLRNKKTNQSLNAKKIIQLVERSKLTDKEGTAYRGDQRNPVSIFSTGFKIKYSSDEPLPEYMETNRRPNKEGYTNGLPIVSTSRSAATALNYSWGMHSGGYLYVCMLDGLKGYDFDSGGQKEVAMENIPSSNIRLAIGPYTTKIRTIVKSIATLGAYELYLLCTKQNHTEDVDISVNDKYKGDQSSVDQEGKKLIKDLGLRLKHREKMHNKEE